MLREPHINLPGIPQHIIQRSNTRGVCFCSDKDYHHYLKYLKKFALKYDCRIHAYVLMTGHVHLLITPMVEHGVSQMMRSLSERYVKYFNRANNRIGNLWEKPFKSSRIDSEIYLLTCMCYIELNPVRVGMVEHPAVYKWSSYQHNAQISENEIIDNHPIYMTLGETEEQQQFVYRGLFLRHLEDDIIHQIRDVLNHKLVLGGSFFKDRTEQITNRKARLGRPGRPRVKEPMADYYTDYDIVT